MRLSNVAWNLGGLAIPLAVAVLTVPTLVERLGQERFGLLALAWGLIGYAGVLDLGIGRALTQMAARLRGEGNVAPIPDLLATAGRITLLTGLGGAALISLLALSDGHRWLGLRSTSPDELSAAILLLAVALPAQAMTATYRGLNEACLNFREISFVRAGLGVVNFGGPWVVAHFTVQLPWLISTLVVSRGLALFVFRGLATGCLRSLEQPVRSGTFSRDIARSLFSFGGWVTISSIVNPFLMQADRFVIASMLSAAAVTIYVLPYEVAAQSLIVASAVSSVMFPGLTQMIREQPQQWRSYFRKWLLRVACAMGVVCALLTLVLPVLLPLWIHSGLAPESIAIGRVLCVGVFAAAIGSMYFALIHAKGRADLTAKLHLAELPAFIGILFFLVDRFGVQGAAWAWAGRMVFDACALAWASRKPIRSSRLGSTP